MSKYKLAEIHDPRVQRTLTTFFDAFETLLADRHYEFIKVKDIIEAAGLNRGTFYLHFENKRDFIRFCVVFGFRKAWKEQQNRSPFPYNESNLRFFIQWTLQFIQSRYIVWNYQWEEILFESGTREAINDFMLGWLKPSDETPISITMIKTCAMVFSSSILGLGMMWCHNGCVEPADLLADQIASIFLFGLPCLKTDD